MEEIGLTAGGVLAVVLGFVAKKFELRGKLRSIFSAADELLDDAEEAADDATDELRSILAEQREAYSYMAERVAELREEITGKDSIIAELRVAVADLEAALEAAARDIVGDE